MEQSSVYKDNVITLISMTTAYAPPTAPVLTEVGVARGGASVGPSPGAGPSPIGLLAGTKKNWSRHLRVSLGVLRSLRCRRPYARARRPSSRSPPSTTTRTRVWLGGSSPSASSQLRMGRRRTHTGRSPGGGAGGVRGLRAGLRT